MLQHNQVTAILPVIDMDRARRFYEKQLGLAPLGPKPDGKFLYRCDSTEIALLPRPAAPRPSIRRSASGSMTSAARFASLRTAACASPTTICRA
jgi:catechol 2,3-dioxygenase-like lactoylglutathione lyase family enzyme